VEEEHQLSSEGEGRGECLASRPGSFVWDLLNASGSAPELVWKYCWRGKSLVTVRNRTYV